MKFQLSGIIGKTRPVQAETASQAAPELLRRFNRTARRAGKPDVLHIPGEVAGDTHHYSPDPETGAGLTSGVRTGHGWVFLISRF